MLVIGRKQAEIKLSAILANKMSKEELEANFLDIGADSADIAIDLIAESELLKDIPVAGLVYKIGKTVGSIPNVIFLHKVGRLIKTVNDKTTETERMAFAEKLNTSKEDRNRLYSQIFLKIDKCDDIDKPDLFGKFFACFIKNKRAVKEFTALSSVLNLAALEELKTFSETYWDYRIKFPHKPVAHDSDCFYGEGCNTLLSTGLITFSLSRSPEKPTSSSSEINSKLEYKMTVLGYLYAYIVEDLDNYFYLSKDKLEGVNHYVFNDTPKEKLLTDIQSRFSKEVS